MKIEIIKQNGIECLAIVVPLNATPVQSKSALAKAAAKGLSADTVPANLLATTGGFTRYGNCKVSLNVLKD